MARLAPLAPLASLALCACGPGGAGGAAPPAASTAIAPGHYAASPSPHRRFRLWLPHGGESQTGALT
ncbi:MAG: hypothetical protein ACKOUM_12535, partial [Sphingopyxis sp.]